MAEAFIQHFPQLGADETRFLTIPNAVPGDRLPAGSYALTEFYCTDPTCDCRRVILNVLERDRGHVATISFGFDRDEEMAGPFLDPLNPQSPYAEELLNLIEQTALADPAYVARLERHYQMMKAKFARPVGPTPKARAEKRRQERRKRRRGK